jgi:formylglycine-generating enzyme required for sulfatase activity/predicted Ser/Thr protein kinase/dienelactone hydrolase
MTDRTISHYRVEEKLGEGGMGVVYRALDTHLDRTVAIKLLRTEAVEDPERKWRFVREAKAASALNHPNIVTIYDIDTADGVDFIAMEYVDGRPLDRVIAGRRLPLEEALSYSVQICAALSAAHAAGIVHRDVKPGNVMVMPDGRVKVLDFGLAKLIERVDIDEAATTTPAGSSLPPQTRGGVILGTLSYMSPEQAEGKPVDARSDVFSFGAVLFEMLTGRRPFQGDSQLSVLTAILRDPPPPLRSVRPDVPAEVERVLRRALEKRPEDRYTSAAPMRDELEACRTRLAAPPVATLLRRPSILIPLLAGLMAVLGAGAWLWWHGSRVRWARDAALPEIIRLTKNNQAVAAFRLARRAERYAPGDVERVRRDLWVAPVTIETAPSGADISIKDYLAPASAWEDLGRSPLANLHLPLGYYRWRIAKTGFQPIEAAAPNRLPSFRLDRPASVPSGMVHVPAGTFQLRSVAAVDLPDYWLDKYEVTNRQFKEFVDRGGYEKKQYWRQPFLKDGRTLSWEEAMAEFRDATGRPGPSTWSLGSYPENQEDYPVGGVSWYEAAAYAEFSGKSLPSIYHWYKAAGLGIFSEILSLSNFGGKGPARVGSYQGLSPYGSYDMAGNVREWCWNETGGKRYILGGFWNDPGYFFSAEIAQSSFDRSAGNGFRCIRTAPPPAEALLRPIETVSRDFSKETPVSDDVFRIYRSFYAYDRAPLVARIDSVDDASPYWRREKVSFAAAYGDERVPAYLFLPRNASPPYQTVVYFPGSGAQMTRSSENIDVRFTDFVIRSGRALLYPIYKETYERLTPEAARGPSFRRDMVVAWSKDLGRSLDYLETRPDIDRTRLAYYGLSLGANDGVILLAIEDRFKAAVLLAGGFRFAHFPPEIDMINFAPRVKTPLLLLGGSEDFQHPVETAQKPLFRLLGAPEKDKRHVVFEGGHVPLRIETLIKEILDWLDRYLGSVKPKG